MSYKICATKRDVNTVGKPLQYFTPSQWIVRIYTGSNAGDYDISDTYELIKNGEVTSLTCNISPINGCVYEGMQVTVGSGIKISFGTLLQKEAANQCVTKEKVLDTNCSLTGESATYASNRLVREEDIVAPSTVNVYYDPRYLTVEEFKTDAVLKAPTTSVDPGVPERTPGDGLDPLMNREFAFLSILCTKGNKVKVRQINTVNSDLVLNAVYAYDNLAAPIYELNAPGYEGAEFIASETCFITFDLVLLTYRLSAAAPVIDCATRWGLTISAYIIPDGDVHYLASAGMDDPKVPMCRPSAEEYMVVPNEAEVNVSLNVNTYETTNTTTFILRNLTTNETTTLTLNDDNECIFKMPSSDCRLETNVVIHEETGDTGFEYENRILTIKSSLLERVVVNGSTYSLYDGVAEVLVPCDESPSALAEVYFDAGMPAVYSIRAYATSQGPASMSRPQSNPNTTLSLSTDMTLEISYSPVSCKYSALDGKISTLDKNLIWSDGTTITGAVYSPSGYLLSTSKVITTSPSDNLFNGKDKLTTVEFYTTSPTFDITRLAFTDCYSLHEVALPNTNLTIGVQAFDNCRSLSKLELPSGLSALGDQVFGENAYKAIYTNPSYIGTASQTNALTFNVDNTYNSSLTELPKFTFEFCKNLAEVYLPASITTIKKGAFHLCNNIKYFAAPGLKIVDERAFLETWIEGTDSDNLSPITINEHSLYYKPNTTGILFDYPSSSTHGLNKNYTLCTYLSPGLNHDNLILYKCNDRQIGIPGTEGWNYTIHPNTISISESAFNGKYNTYNFMTNFSKLEYIGDKAFEDNSNLRVFNMPNNGTVSYLGNSAFRNCKRLSEIINFKQLPITKIEDYTFDHCGDNKYGLGALTDAGYPNLDFNIPDTTTEIGNYAFANCPLLMAIANLPSCQITKIGDHAFEASFQNSTWKTQLGEEIALFTTMMVLSLAGGICYSGYINGSLLVINNVNNLIAGCIGTVGGTAGTIASIATTGKNYRKQTVELFFPKVTHIGVAAFKNCSHLGAIHLSELLTAIPDYCFENCKKLHTFLFDSQYDSNTGVCTDRMSNITTIGRRAFYNCKNLKVASMNRLLCKAEVLDVLAFANAKLTPSGDENLVIFPKTIHTLQEQSLLISNGMTCIFLSQTPPANVHSNVFGTTIKSKITMFVPQGSKSSYLQKFTTLSSSNFIELSDTDPFWESLNDVYSL